MKTLPEMNTTVATASGEKTTSATVAGKATSAWLSKPRAAALLLLLVAGACIAGSDLLDPWSTPPPVPGGTVAGRFAVVVAPSEPGDPPIAFRVDTFTGQTWRYQETLVGRTTADGWLRVPEKWAEMVQYISDQTTSRTTSPPASH
jgi:hypothetical protein